MRVEPDDAAGRAVVCREPGQRPERNRMVTAEDERHCPVGQRLRHERRDPRAGVEDLRQVARALVDHAAPSGCAVSTLP